MSFIGEMSHPRYESSRIFQTGVLLLEWFLPGCLTPAAFAKKECGLWFGWPGRPAEPQTAEKTGEPRSGEGGKHQRFWDLFQKSGMTHTISNFSSERFARGIVSPETPAPAALAKK